MKMADKPLLLLVEDEALLAVPLEQELVDAGFEVLLALDGQEALGEVERNASRFAGLITDIRLPAVNGWAISKRARELVPTMPVVYMSGDSAAEWTANGVPNSIMLQKPFAAAQLTAAITKLINEVPPHAPDQRCLTSNRSQPADQYRTVPARNEHQQHNCSGNATVLTFVRPLTENGATASVH